MSHSKRIDPDPFTVISAVAAAVSAICAVVAVSRNSVVPPQPRSKFDHWSNHLLEEVDELSRDIKKLIRWLPSIDGIEFDPLLRKFTFGETSLLLNANDLQRYDEITQWVANRLGDLMRSTVAFCQHDPGFAHDVGLGVLREMSNVSDRVNNLFRSDMTNGEVLDECLLIVQTFERIMSNLKLSGNK